MKGGEKIYPHEGLKDAEFIIERIRCGAVFSEEAFQYALYRSHEYATADEDRYADFSLEKAYGIKIMRRGSPQEMQGMCEPWMLPEKESEPDVVDFKPKRCAPGIENLWSWSAIGDLYALMHARIPNF